MGCCLILDRASKMTLVIVSYETLFSTFVVTNLFLALQKNIFPNLFIYGEPPDLPLGELQFWSIIGLIFIHLTVVCTGCVFVLGSMEGSPEYLLLWSKTIVLSSLPTAYTVLINQGLNSPSNFCTYGLITVIFTGIQALSIIAILTQPKELTMKTKEAEAIPHSQLPIPWRPVTKDNDNKSSS